MSIPKFGISEEVKGRFDCEVVYHLLDEVIRFSIGDTLIFENQYYQNLYEKGKIELVLSVDCFNAYKEDKVCIREEKYLDYPIKDVGGKFTVTIYFIAKENFKLDTQNEFFDEFFNETYAILKGQIVSKVVTRYIDIQTTSTYTSAKLLELVHDLNQDEAFIFRLAQQSPIVSVKSDDLYYKYDKLRNSKRMKGIKELVDSILLGPVYVELIRVLIEDRLEGENYEWAESIALALGFSSLDELRKELEEVELDPENSFQTAYNHYATKMFSNNYLLDLLNHLNTY